MIYRIKIIHAAQKRLLSFSGQARMEIARAIDGLANDPRPPGCKKLRETVLWRIRVGRYRIIYIIDDKNTLITVVKIAQRREDTYHGL